MIPIKTIWFYNDIFGIKCPFCLIWNSIEKNNVGKIICCNNCNKLIKTNQFVIENKFMIPERKIITKIKNVEMNGSIVIE